MLPPVSHKRETGVSCYSSFLKNITLLIIVYFSLIILFVYSSVYCADFCIILGFCLKILTLKGKKRLNVCLIRPLKFVTEIWYNISVGKAA